MNRLFPRLAAAVLAFVCLAGTAVSADNATEMAVTPGNTYSLDFSKEYWYSTNKEYYLTYTATKTAEYEMFSSGSFGIGIRLYEDGYGSRGEPQPKEGDEKNTYIKYTLQKGASYRYQVYRKSSDDTTGPTDVTVTFREYTDTSPVIAHFDNAADFPDTAFSAVMKEKADLNKDDQLTSYEADKIDYLTIDDKGIANLKGIEFFKNIGYLYCNKNSLTFITLKDFPKLSFVSCYNNQLVSLEITGCPKLDRLYCESNKLASLNLANMPRLYSLDCSDNDLTSLDLSGNPVLNNISCYNNHITELDLSSCPVIRSIDARNNELRNIDLKGCSMLQKLDVGTNNSSVNNNALTSIDLSDCPDLEDLDVKGNQIKVLDLTKNPGLKDLNCDANGLKTLKIKACSDLNWLSCSENQLQTLDISDNTELVTLWCNDNQLSSLDISSHIRLEKVNCRDNNISKLDISNSPKLLKAYNNSSPSDSGYYYYSSNSGYPKKEYYLMHDVKDGVDFELITDKPKPSTDLSIDDNFPDPEFRRFVKEKLDQDKNGYLSPTEIADATEVRLFDYDVADMTGIRFLTNTEDITLAAAGVNITVKSLDVSGLTKLQRISCSGIKLEQLNIKGCRSIRTLYLGATNLTSLDLSECPKLETLEVNNTYNLESLDLSKCPNLKCLNVTHIDRLDTYDISGCPFLIKTFLEGTKDLDINRRPRYVLMSGSYQITCDEDDTFIYDKPKPTLTTAPTVPVKPTVSPSAAPKASPSVTPKATVSPKATVKPKASVTPKVTSKPKVTTKPAVTAKPTVTSKPGVTSKPSVTSKPGVTSKPSVTAKPNVTSKPKATVTPKSDVRLTLDKKTADIVCGKTITLKATLKGSGNKITWKSSDTKIATVDKNGKVTAKQAGAVTITAQASGKTAACNIQILFKDVTNEKDFWYKPTYYLANTGVVKGYDKQTKFKPANECTRAQMVTFIWRLKGEPAPKTKTCKFKDVKKTDYFYKACIWGNENNIVEGYKDGTFGPQIVCARRHAVTFLWRLAGKPSPKTTKNKFKDVKKSDYFYKATLWASEKGILAGYSDKTFRPNGNCLRRQMVTFLYKYDKFVNKKG